MKTILKLIFFPILIVIMVLKGVLKGMFGSRNLKHIPKVIEKLANDDCPLGTAFDEIKYPQVVAYAEENGTILIKSDGYCEFNTRINETVYLVTVNRAPDGSNCAVFRSRIHNAEEKNKTTNYAEKKTSSFDENVDLLNSAYSDHIKNGRW